MLLLHGLEHGTIPDRVSNDIDTAVDVRADPRVVAKLVDVLAQLEYTNVGASPEGHAHRYQRPKIDRAAVDVITDEEDVGSGNDLVLDLLVPDNLGERADIGTIGRATAFPAPGVHQALRRTVRVPVVIEGSVYSIPRPSLFGAIVAKATACDADNRDTGRRHTDLAFLCGLVEDPVAMAQEVTKSVRRRLRRSAQILPADHGIWRHDPDALAALEILSTPPPAPR